MQIFSLKVSSMRATSAYYMPKTGLKAKHFHIPFMLHRKPSTEECCFAACEEDSYYLLSTNATDFETAFTQEQ